MIGRNEHSDSVNGYSLREEKAKEKYYEEKEKTDMEMTIQHLDAIGYSHQTSPLVPNQIDPL